MNARALFVDDEPNILSGIKRQLRKRIDVVTADSGERGLEIVQQDGPFAVVVSDMRMPGMNGAQFLSEVRRIAPDSIRMILSGQSDLDAAISAVNDGHIFRFLTKPCDAEPLWTAIEAGIRQYELLHVEKELLEKTLGGAVRVMSELLGMVNSRASDKARRVQNIAEQLAAPLGMNDNWEFRIAVMLSQIGCVGVPPNALAKAEAGEALTAEEQQLYDAHSEVASGLLKNIPRLENVASMVAGQSSPAQTASNAVGLGGLLLHAAARVDTAVVLGQSLDDAAAAVAASLPGAPDNLLSALGSLGKAQDAWITQSLPLKQVVSGMVLEEDIQTESGMCLLAKGAEITEAHLVRLTAAATRVGLVEPFKVRVRAQDKTEAA